MLPRGLILPIVVVAVGRVRTIFLNLMSDLSAAGMSDTAAAEMINHWQSGIIFQLY